MSMLVNVSDSARFLSCSSESYMNTLENKLSLPTPLFSKILDKKADQNHINFVASYTLTHKLNSVFSRDTVGTLR